MHRHHAATAVIAVTVAALALMLTACGEEPAAEHAGPDADAGHAHPEAADHAENRADDHDHAQDHAHDHAHDGEHNHAHDDHGHDHDHDHHHHDHDNGDTPAPPERGDAYTLATCPVSGLELGSMGEPIVYEHEGRQVRFCCDECIEPFEDEPQRHLEQIDEKIVEQQLAHYPLDTCVISGAELGSMGEPVNYVYANRLVRFCCSGCDDDFEADPAAHLATIDEAVIEREKADYPLERCVVSGEPLDEWGDPVDMVVANRLVRFCCDTCAEDFHADPAGYLAMRDAGRIADEAAHDHDDHHAH